MSGRLDAFFSLTLCHAVVASILFAGALSFYAPLAANYNRLASLTGLLYWVLVLFVATLLTGTVQLVMRMVRIGSGELLQRYRRVGVLLANPEPLGGGEPRQSLAYSSNNNNNNNNNDDDDDSDIASTSPLLPPGPGNRSYSTDMRTLPGLADDGSSSALWSWLQRLGVTDPTNKQNNNDDSIVACTPCDADVPSPPDAGLSHAPCIQLRRNNNNNNNNNTGYDDNDDNNDDIIGLVTRNECWHPFSSHGTNISTRSLLPLSSSSSSSSSSSAVASAAGKDDDVIDDVKAGARNLPSKRCSCGPGQQPAAVRDSVVVALDAVPRELNNNDNSNNNDGDDNNKKGGSHDNDNNNNNDDDNDDKKDGSQDKAKVVSVTVQSAHQRHHDANVSSNAAGHHDHDNISSNAGAEDVPARASRRSSAERPSRQSSAVDEVVNLLSRKSSTEARRSSAGGSQEVARRSSSTAGARESANEARRSSGTAGGRGSAAEPRRSSAARWSSREMSIADRRSSTGQSMSAEARRSSAEARRSSAGVEPRRSSGGVEPRRSSGTETRRSSGGVESGRSSGDVEYRGSSVAEPRRSSGGVEARRSSASAEARRSSAFVEEDDGNQRRRSSGGDDLRRRWSRGLEVSDEAAQRSYSAGTADVAGIQSSVDFTSQRGGGSDARPCCDPVPPSPCASCCRPGVRPDTCWCRCPSEIHDPELLDDCCGSRDGRLLSLPGFPRSKSSCNSCFTPCKPLPPICSKTPDCEPRCRSVHFRFHCL